MMLLIIFLSYFVGLGLVYKILDDIDDFSDYEGLIAFFSIIWPITLPVLIGNKIGSKISKFFLILTISLFCFSCHSVCYKGHREQDKKIKHATGKKLGQQARIYTYKGR